MTSTEYRDRKLRYDRAKQLLDTSELMILCIVIVWGLMLALSFLGTARGDAPLFSSITPYIPMPIHGVSLLVLGAIHLTVIFANNTTWRRRCIGAQMLFFLYAAWTLVLHGRTGLELVGVLIYIVFSAMNFQSLLRPLK
jgi:hypothetical protein